MSKAIQDFCKNADSIAVNTNNVKCLDDLTIKINPSLDMVYRSRTGAAICYFNLSFGFNKSITLDDEIGYMRTIELFYPNTFSWRFTGEHIEVINKIEIKKEYLGIFTRFKSIMDFITSLRKRILEVLKYRSYNNFQIAEHVDLMIISNGSINSSQGMFVVNIQPNMTKMEILTKSKDGVIDQNGAKKLDMKYWVKEINPDFTNQFKVFTKQRKWLLEKDVYLKYPPCIKQIAELKYKGNYNRFLLTTFLLTVHREKDAKYQLDMMLSKSERDHINFGNCNNQFRYILIKQYPPPSCKNMVENGYCTGCKRVQPHRLEIEV